MKLSRRAWRRARGAPAVGRTIIMCRAAGVAEAEALASIYRVACESTVALYLSAVHTMVHTSQFN